MTRINIIKPHSRKPMALGVAFVLAASLAIGTVPATADDHGHDRRDYHRDDHRGHPGGWTGGYYPPPPVVYGGPYYAPPPVVYGPGVSINLPA